MQARDTLSHRTEAAAKSDRINGLSIVVPVFNEVGNVEPLYLETIEALTDIAKPYEIIFIDDGSDDGTTEVLSRLASSDPNTKLLIFRRNYGQTAALKAGIDHAQMDAIVTIDGDGQNDPADIKMMVEALEDGYDLVHGWRAHRKDSFVNRKLPSKIANWLISRVTHFPIHDLGCTLKVMRRSILNEIELYGDMHRFIPILLFQRGARCREVETHHRARVSGETKYGIGRTFVVLLDLLLVKYILEYAAHPIRLFGGLAILSFALGLVAFVATVAMKVFGGTDMTGNPLLLATVVAALAGLQLLSLGIIAEVLARLYYGQARKDPYAVREYVNFADTAADNAR